MELLETQDPEKQKLIESSNLHRREIEKELSSVSDRTQSVITNALIVGGALALAYFTFTQLSHKKKKRKKPKSSTQGEEIDEAPKEPSIISQVGEQIITQAMLMLLDIGRAKLAEYLQSRKETRDNSVDQKDQFIGKRL